MGDIALLGWAGVEDLRNSFNLASCSKTSDSVTLERVGATCDAGTAVGVGRGGEAAVVGVGVGSLVAMGGTEGARGVEDGDVALEGFVELGLFVHASSSKPFWTTEAELGRGRTVTGLGTVAGLWLCGDVVCCIWSEADVIALRSTFEGGRLLLGCGRPRLGFKIPPGPENRLGAVPFEDGEPSWA